MTTKNLDAIINKIGFNIAEAIGNKSKYKNEIDKSLGVLSNDGVYAYYVYIKSKKVDDVFLEKVKPLTKFIEGNNTEQEPDEKFFQKLSENLNNLLFFRELLEKVLIYARYHVKAMGD